MKRLASPGLTELFGAGMVVSARAAEDEKIRKLIDWMPTMKRMTNTQ